MTRSPQRPATTYPIKATGRTLATTPRLAGDVRRQISVYSKNTGGGPFVFSAHMRVMTRAHAPVARTFPHRDVALAARSSDFAVTPISGPLPLHSH